MFSYFSWEIQTCSWRSVCASYSTIFFNYPIFDWLYWHWNYLTQKHNGLIWLRPQNICHFSINISIFIMIIQHFSVSSNLKRIECCLYLLFFCLLLPSAYRTFLERNQRGNLLLRLHGLAWTDHVRVGTFCCADAKQRCHNECSGKSCTDRCEDRCGIFNDYCGKYLKIASLLLLISDKSPELVIGLRSPGIFILQAPGRVRRSTVVAASVLPHPHLHRHHLPVAPPRGEIAL